MGDTQIARSKFTLETSVDIEFDAKDVIQNLRPLQVADLIMELDDEVGDWEHTLLLYHYFAAQFEIAKSKVPELAAMSQDELRDLMQEALKEEASTDVG